jgi:menaquinone-specific isochorismate synthase
MRGVDGGGIVRLKGVASRVGSMARREGEEAVLRSGPVVSRGRRIDATLRGALRAFPGPRMAWSPPDGPALVGCGTAASITASGPDRFDTVREAAEGLLSSVDVDADGSPPDALEPRLVGGFSFHDGFRSAAPWHGFPGARFVLPRFTVVAAGGETWLSVTEAGPDATPASVAAALDTAEARIERAPDRSGPSPGVASAERVPDRAGWRDQVERALEQIAADELEKVVLAGQLTARLHGTFLLADTLARLDRAYPDCYRFAVDPGMGAAFFGATPERLVTRDGSRVQTVALAGSVGRGGTADEDDRLAAELESSPKIRHEHDLVVGAIRDQLRSVAADVSVGEAGIRKLANVQHLETPITADLDDGTHVLDLVEALHPTPAVGGLPPEAAGRTIAETERFDRGWYAAPVGWFDAAGDGTFAVGIRSAVAGSERATLFAGNGIVPDSDPDDEWDELQLKYRPILDQLR